MECISSISDRRHDAYSSRSASLEGRPSMPKQQCWACGKFHAGGKPNCHFVKENHPDINRENVPWEQPEKGKLLKKHTIRSSMHLTSDGEWKRLNIPLLDKDKGIPQSEKVCFTSSEKAIPKLI